MVKWKHQKALQNWKIFPDFIFHFFMLMFLYMEKDRKIIWKINVTTNILFSKLDGDF